MIYLIRASRSDPYSELMRDMFEDRAVQFRDRRQWDLELDAEGGERDAYDALDPLYLILTDAQGGHAGSMRFLPTTGPTMVNDHFMDLLGGAPLTSPRIWECTRFCLSPRLQQPGRHAARLMAAALAMGLHLGLVGSVGVFDAPMRRVYARLGWSPHVVGARHGIGAGIWAFDPACYPKLLQAAGWRRSYVKNRVRRWLL